MTLPFLWDIRGYLGRVWARLLVGSLSGIVMNTAVVLPAILLGRALDAALAFERGQADGAAMTRAALVFVAGTLATELPRIAKRYYLQTGNARIRADIRADAFRSVVSWPMERLQRTSVGELMGRMVSDVEVVSVGIRELTTEIWDTVLFCLSLIVAMFIYDSRLTALALIPVPAAMVVAQLSGRWVTGRTTATRQANAALTSAIQELLGGVRVLRMFGRSQATIARVRTLSEAQASANVRLALLKGGLQPIYSTLMMAGLLLIVWQGGERVVAGAMTVGAFVAYLQLFLKFVARGYRVPQLLNSVQSGAAAWARVRPLIDTPPRIVPRPRPASRAPGPLGVQIRDVSFRYPGATAFALSDISLEIPRGALVAITGSVGSGKTSLARAVLGVYPVERGEVLIDGTPVSEFTPEERTLVGYLPQQAQLFSGTVEENIFFGSPTRESIATTAVGRATELSALAHDIESFPAGLQTEIGELGMRISGGQRLRVALARALGAAIPQSPGLLVLDDPFSGVDVDTEARIVAGLRAAFGPDAPPDERATILLCSHRLAAFPYADVVVVLQDGRIEEQGTHLKLLEADGLYTRIFNAQRWVTQPASGPSAVVHP